MKKKITLERAQSASVTATTKTIAGHKVWPVTHGHIIWLRDIRKNKIICGKAEDDFAMAEICYAFTQAPLPLQRIVGTKAKTAVETLLIESTPAALISLFTYASEQLEIYLKTLTAPKKQPAEASRKPAARVRKR